MLTGRLRLAFLWLLLRLFQPLFAFGLLLLLSKERFVYDSHAATIEVPILACLGTFVLTLFWYAAMIGGLEQQERANLNSEAAWKRAKDEAKKDIQRSIALKATLGMIRDLAGIEAARDEPGVALEAIRVMAEYALDYYEREN